jgi:hypothetical protein
VALLFSHFFSHFCDAVAHWAKTDLFLVKFGSNDFAESHCTVFTFPTLSPAPPPVNDAVALHRP